MKGYAEREMFSEKALAIHRKATELVACLKTHLDEDGREIRCHELARALGRALQLKVIDGATIGVDHSWLIVDRTTYLDPYAPARVPMVQLVDISTPTLSRLMYNLDSRPRDDISEDVVNDLFARMVEHDSELQAMLPLRAGLTAR